MTTAQMKKPAVERAKAPLGGSLKTKLATLCAPLARASLAIDAALAAWLLVAAVSLVIGG